MVKEELPVDKGWAWAVCGAVFIIMFLMSATGQMISVTLVDLVYKYDTTITTVSLMFMFQIAATSACSVAATNFFVPRFGIRRVCVVSAAIGVLASMIFTVSPSIYMCIALYTIKGACNGLMAIPAISILGYYFRRRRSIATSLAMCGICSGSIAYPPFVRYILGIYGLQGTYLICSAIEAHLIFAGMLIRPVSGYRIPSPSEKSPDDQELTKYELKPSGSMENVSQQDDDYINEKDPERLLGNHEHKHHIYQKKNGTSIPSKHGDIRTRTVSFNDEDKESSPKQSLISDSKDNVSNQQSFSSKEKIAKSKEAYRNSRSVSVNSDEALQHKQRLLKEGQRPSLWSLTSNPSTLGLPAETEILQEQDENQTERSACWWRVNRIFDLSLFKLWPFVWMLIAAFPCGTNQLMFVFLPTIGYLRGVTKDESALLLTILGSVDLVSRLFVGMFADKRYLRISTIIGIASICLGIVSLFIELFDNMPTLIVMAVLLGLFVGTRMSLGTVMFIEIVGLERMAKAFSLYAMFLTMSGAIHSPLLGQMMETQGVPSMMYYMAFTFILSGLMVLAIPLVQRVEGKCKPSSSNQETKDDIQKLQA